MCMWFSGEELNIWSGSLIRSPSHALKTKVYLHATQKQITLNYNDREGHATSTHAHAFDTYVVIDRSCASALKLQVLKLQISFVVCETANRPQMCMRVFLVYIL